MREFQKTRTLTLKIVGQSENEIKINIVKMFK